MPQVGQPAPDFEAVDDRGQTVRLSDFRGQRVLIFFYPKANTRTCTEEACMFRDHYDEYTGKNVVIMGISPDSAEEIRAFRANYKLPYHLIPDPERRILSLYGVWGTYEIANNTGQRVDSIGVRRISYLIDARGFIMREVDSDDPQHHHEYMLDALDHLPGVAP